MNERFVIADSAPATGGARPPPGAPVRASAASAESLFVFLLDEQRYALRLAAVDSVAAMVRVTPLPGAPRVVLGVIDVRGELVVVFDVRARLQLPPRAPTPEQHLVIARSQRRRVALVADRTSGIVQVEAASIDAGVAAGVPHIDGVARQADGLLLIHDLDRFLSSEERRALDDALAAR